MKGGPDVARLFFPSQAVCGSAPILNFRAAALIYLTVCVNPVPAKEPRLHSRPEPLVGDRVTRREAWLNPQHAELLGADVEPLRKLGIVQIAAPFPRSSDGATALPGVGGFHIRVTAHGRCSQAPPLSRRRAPPEAAEASAAPVRDRESRAKPRPSRCSRQRDRLAYRVRPGSYPALGAAQPTPRSDRCNCGSYNLA